MKKNRYDFCLPTLGGSWLLVALFIAGSLIFGLILGWAQGISGSAILKAQSLSYILSFVIPFAFIFLKAGQAMNAENAVSRPVDRLDSGGFKPLAFFGVIALAMLALTVIIEPLSTFIPMPDSIKDLFEKIFNNSSTFDLVLSTCILAPLCEEFFCRGIMMRGIMNHSTPWKAIFWSAFIFAAIHMNPWQSIPAFIIGVFFGWIYYRTGSLRATIFLHCLNNSTAVALSKIFPDMGADEGIIDLMPAGQYAVLYAVCLAVAAVCILLLNKKLPHKSDK